MVSSELLHRGLDSDVGEGAALRFEGQCGSIELLQESAYGSKLYGQRTCIQGASNNKGTSLCLCNTVAHWSPSGCLMTDVLGLGVPPWGEVL
jgi:hypothetical protein